jgi:hypothetical protein
VDFYLSETRDREAAKCFLKRALANPDNRPPHVFARDQLRSYSAAIRELQMEGQLCRTCRQRTRRYSNNRIESDHRHVKRRLRAMQGPRTMATACAVIAGIEAVQMIRKGQVLGITRSNISGQVWVFWSPFRSQLKARRTSVVYYPIPLRPSASTLLQHYRSSTSRRLSENRRYQRTQVTIISAANCRFRNGGFWQNFIRSPYQIRHTEAATLPARPDQHIFRPRRTDDSRGIGPDQINGGSK